MKMVLTVKGVIPVGVPCLACGKVAKPGQWVAHKSLPGVMHVVIHRGCLMDLHEEVDEDVMDPKVEDSWLAIKKELELTNGDPWTL